MKLKSLITKLSLAVIGLASLVSIASLGSCKSSEDSPYNSITFNVAEDKDTAVCQLPQSSFLGIDTRFTINLPTRKSAKVRVQFACNNDVRWNLTDIPGDISVEPSVSGNGTGYFVISIPEVTEALNRRMFMTLRQFNDKEDKELTRLSHSIVITQP